jgi:uncharacterized metal-binding protein YceD (DUF177 family)
MTCAKIYDMNVLERYKIDLLGLKNEAYTFDFILEEAFFQALQTDLLEKGTLHAEVQLRKSELMLQLEIHIKGFIELICDRSLEPFDYPIDLTERLILQFGDKEESLDDGLDIIPRNANTVPLAQYFYEYIAMEIPFKKLHPQFADEVDEDEEADVKLVYSSSTDPTDERWEALKKISDN